jgi:hypothetical protein
MSVGFGVVDAQEEVVLHIYHVWGSDSAMPLNTLLAAFGSGAFHCGMEVAGIEWSFGPLAQEGDSGVCARVPVLNKDYRHYMSVTLGCTGLAQDEVFACLRKLEEEWLAGTYDLLRRNCCHFASAVAAELGVSPPPAWVGFLPAAGAVIASLWCSTASFAGKAAESALRCGRHRASEPSVDATLPDTYCLE